MDALFTPQSVAVGLLALALVFIVALFFSDSLRRRRRLRSGIELFKHARRRRWPFVMSLGLLALVLAYLAVRATYPGPPATGAVEPGAPAPAPAPLPVPGPAPVLPAAAEPTATPQADATAAVNHWRDAWVARDADRYLAAYADDFRPADGQPLAAWQKQRRERLDTPREISLSLERLTVTVEGDRASARFIQHYRSGPVNARERKRLSLRRTAQGWLITEEVIEKVRAP